MVLVVNIFLLLLIGVCLYVAFHVNLFECALLLGRSFFAFFVGLGFAVPLAGAMKASFPLSTVYLETAACFLVWLGTFVAVEALARRFVGTRTINSMKFDQLLALPARLATGLIAGFLVAGVFAVTLVSLPAVEGAYIESEANVVGGLHGRAAGLFAAGKSAFTSRKVTSHDVLRRTQIRAAKLWARRNMPGLQPVKRQRLIRDLEDRYGDLLRREDMQELWQYARQERSRADAEPPP